MRWTQRWKNFRVIPHLRCIRSLICLMLFKVCGMFKSNSSYTPNWLLLKYSLNNVCIPLWNGNWPWVVVGRCKVFESGFPAVTCILCHKCRLCSLPCTYKDPILPQILGSPENISTRQESIPISISAFAVVFKCKFEVRKTTNFVRFFADTPNQRV